MRSEPVTQSAGATFTYLPRICKPKNLVTESPGRKRMRQENPRLLPLSPGSRSVPVMSEVTPASKREVPRISPAEMCVRWLA